MAGESEGSVGLGKRRALLVGAGGAGLALLASSLAQGPEIAPDPFPKDFDWGEPAVLTTIVDGHLHVWSDGEAPFPWAEGHAPPPELAGANAPTAEALVALMDANTVTGALIIQPINHKFDHSYVASALKKWPDRFKGMCLANPTLPQDEALADLAALKAQGFVGARFNPALWPPATGGMGGPLGEAMFAKCGELGMPVGIMCFDGFAPQEPAIRDLATKHPETMVIIDHFGFVPFRSRAPVVSVLDKEPDEREWELLLSLAELPNIHVKCSAPFRVSEFAYPHEDVFPRMVELLEAYGADRVLFGSDYPFCLAEFGENKVKGYGAATQQVFTWQLPISNEDQQLVLRGTAEKLFGKWG